MIVRNMIQLCAFLFLFYLLYVVYPSLCCGNLLKKQGYPIADRVLIYLIVSTFGYAFLGYGLAALRILNGPVLWLILLATFLLCRSMQNGWQKIPDYWRTKRSQIIDFPIKSTSIRLHWEQKIKYGYGIAARWIVSCVRDHPGRCLAIMAFLGVFCYTRFYPMVMNDWFGQPDMYVHLSWVELIQGGDIFPKGIYPEAMHVNMLVLTDLFGLDPVFVVKYWGAANALMVLWGLYCLLTRCYKNPTTIIAGFWLVFCSGIVANGVFNRLAYSLPQEHAWVFMIASGLFLLDYLATKRKSSLLFLGLSFALTIMIHFYITMMTGFFLVSIVLCNLRTCFRKTVLWRLIAAAIASCAVACLPFIVAAAMGNEWNGSIDWALSVMQSAETVREEELEEPDDTILTEEEKTNWVEQALTGFETFRVKQVVPVCAGMTLLSAGIFLYRLIRKRWTAQNAAQASLLGYGLIISGLLLWDMLGGPTLMPIDRMVMFLAIFLLFGLLTPVDTLLCWLKDDVPREAIAKRLLQVSIVLFFLWMLADARMLMGLGYGFQSEYNEAVRFVEQVKKEYPPHTWTLVTTTDSLYRISDVGYHYETWEFLRTMEADSDKAIRIPTPYIFFIVEKKTLQLEHGNWFSHGQRQGIEVSPKAAQDRTIFSDPDVLDWPYDYFYATEENRAIIDSKFYLWAQTYQEYFPKEMQVLFEDQYVKIYRFHQETNTAVNFSLPYWDAEVTSEVHP